ncbi:hypothetical protein MRX96_014373 [Rhipicephalus microplus]
MAEVATRKPKKKSGTGRPAAGIPPPRPCRRCRESPAVIHAWPDAAARDKWARTGSPDQQPDEGLAAARASRGQPLSLSGGTVR